MRLTDATVKELRCPEGKKDALFFDDTLKGFGVRVMPDRADGRARKVFILQYRAGEKVRREPLGDWGSELTAVQARRKAEALRGAVRDRRDPVGERQAASAAQRAAEKTRKQAAAVEAFTLDKLVTAWDTRALALRRPSYRREAAARVRQGLATWLDRPAASMARTDAAAAVQDFADTRGTVGANRLLAYARACYGWGIKAGLVTDNPFTNLPLPGREVARDRVLTQGELAAIWTASDTLAPVQRAFVRFLMLTLQRRTEVAGARWTEFAPDLSTWTVPAERAKNGRAHLVHLASEAQAVLAEVPRVAGRKLVFTLPMAKGKEEGQQKQLTAFSAIKRALDAAMERAETEAAAADGREPVPVPPWTFHNFRRTGVTALAGMGYPPHVCDRLLNHVTGAIQGVAAVYQRAEFLAERKAALEAWARVLDARNRTSHAV